MNKNLHSLSERRERKENRSIRSIFSKGKKRRKEEIEIEPKKTKSDEITLKACNCRCLPLLDSYKAAD